MEDHKIETIDTNEDLVSPARRRLLAKAGTYAVVTPPAVSFMLSTALAGQQVAKSGGGDMTWKERKLERQLAKKQAKQAAKKQAKQAAKKQAKQAAKREAKRLERLNGGN